MAFFRKETGPGRPKREYLVYKCFALTCTVIFQLIEETEDIYGKLNKEKCELSGVIIYGGID